MASPDKHHFLVDRNVEHLRLLGIYHWVIASGVALLGIIFYALPLFISFIKTLSPNAAWGPHLGGLLVVGAQVVVLGLNGWCLRQRKNWLSCVILSCIECVCAPPLGLLLGVSAVLVLRREAVQALFSMKNHKPADSAP